MDQLILRRRQLLYFGLGLMGAGVTSACGLGTKKNVIKKLDSTPSAGSNTAAPADLTKPVASTSKELPEFQGIQEWLNSPPLTKADLKGSVVLLQFWTFACINCQRTLPYVTSWHQKYAPQGLKVVGVHAPEFHFERQIKNIQAAMKRHGINYPVAVDNSFKTWQAYNNKYWPHLFLADRQGLIQYDHIGEGAYSETEQMIQKLLKS